MLGLLTFNFKHFANLKSEKEVGCRRSIVEYLESSRPRQGPRLTLGSQTGERTPKKAIFQLWRSGSQSKKILHQKAQRNWNQSCINIRFCHFEPIWQVSSAHCGPLTPFPQFRHFSGSQCKEGFLLVHHLYLRKEPLLYFSPQIGVFPTVFVILQHAATT